MARTGEHLRLTFDHIFCAFLVWLAKRAVAFSSSLLISARSFLRAAGFASWLSKYVVQLKFGLGSAGLVMTTRYH